MSETYPICFRCALVNTTCCKADPANTNACFPLSEAEAKRLAPYAKELGIPPYETETNNKDFLHLMYPLFPDKRTVLEKAFPLGGEHRRLPLSGDGKCLFLQDDGCFLPRAVRPWYCQLFPIWVRKGYFDRFHSNACLITHEVKRLPDVFEAIGLTRETAKEIYGALCRDWGMETHDSE